MRDDDRDGAVNSHCRRAHLGAHAADAQTRSACFAGMVAHRLGFVHQGDALCLRGRFRISIVKSVDRREVQTVVNEKITHTSVGRMDLVEPAVVKGMMRTFAGGVVSFASKCTMSVDVNCLHNLNNSPSS